MVGKTLGHYEILEPLGKGGMGEVYRARDTKLDRDVAIKVLPENFATDHDRLARFEREAKLLASLNHANIAAIYGLEDEGDQRFIAMELVEGETLAERISRSGRIEVDEALEIARQIAEALEAAHENGVIHRDLKPANVIVTSDGKAKVLDFGLAKAYEAEGVASGNSHDLSHSPTMMAATGTGVIMGTAAYMSPEQARGKPLDKRTDIWSFGCVLFEMLTANSTFGGEDASETLASILKEEPVWDELPESVPGHIRDLLSRCLDKRPNGRLRDIGEARIACERCLAGPRATTPDRDAPSPSGTRFGRTQVGIAAVLAVALIGMGVWLGRWTVAPPAAVPLQRFALTADELGTTYDAMPAISPDGTMIVYPSSGQLWIRHLDQLNGRPLRGTDGGTFPFWSPDSAQLAFAAEGVLWRLPVAGGDRKAITEVTELEDGFWGPGDRIIIGFMDTIAEVSRGGDPELIVPIDRETEADFHHPVLLPDGRSIVFRVHRRNAPDQIDVWDGAVRRTLWELEAGQVVADLTYSSSGHLVYGRSGGTNEGIWAIPFSPTTLQVTGEPFLVSAGNSGPSISNDGALVYVEGLGVSFQVSQLRWINRDGTVGAAISSAQEMRQPALSPDETRVAVSAAEGGVVATIWIHEVGGGRVALTTAVDSAWDFAPEWIPETEEIAYSHFSGVGAKVQAVTIDGGPPRVLANGERPTFSGDGKLLLYSLRETAEASRDIWYQPYNESEAEATRFLETDYEEDQPRLSPNGRWIAFTSDESGEREIHVRSFPDGGGWRVVSLNGGSHPHWRADSGELFFVETGKGIMARTVRSNDPLEFDQPVLVVRDEFPELGALRLEYGYDVSADGARFVVLTDSGDTDNVSRVILVQNWFEELDRLSPARSQ